MLNNGTTQIPPGGRRNEYPPSHSPGSGNFAKRMGHEGTISEKATPNPSAQIRRAATEAIKAVKKQKTGG